MEIKVTYHNDKIKRLERIKQGDWIDLAAAKDYYIERGAFALIDFGITIKVRKDYETWIVPRSSTFKKYGLIQTNGIGIIDSSYCGENDIIKMPVYATRDCYVKQGERIAQFRIIKSMSDIDIKERAVIDITEESRGGFGSTGR